MSLPNKFILIKEGDNRLFIKKNSNKKIHSKNDLIHEHYYITKNSNYISQTMKCIFCNSEYCQSSGRLILNPQ